MSFKVMPKTAVPAWVSRLLQEYRVAGPQRLQDRFIFEELASPEQLELGYTTTILPPKKFLLPQREELFRFDMKDGTVEPVLDARPTILLGVHTCDLHAIQLLDSALLGGYTDQHYRARRDATLIVSIECLTPCSETSFCKSMGTLSITEGFDLHLTPVGDEYAVDVGTERGAALLEGIEELRDATDADYERLNRTLSEKWPRFPYRLEADVNDLSSLLSVSYDSDLWDELGERCLGCGSCTMVCPTCYCFNVVDEVDFTLSAGRRYREWDGCPLSQFAVVAGGHNFRKTNAARQRHRFFRKGKYQMDTRGLVGCVGCGRCGTACLVNINPVDTFNELARRRIPVTRRHQESMT
jgi:formate hydrogenlyase subunit 6/NADH:ubiquinone oxidoreductase subunit I